MMKSRTWKRVLAAVCGVAAVSMAACGGGTNNTANTAKDGVIINRVL